MKLLVLLIFLVALPGLLLPAADWVLGRMSEWGKVVFVMAVFPLVMNVLQVRGARVQWKHGADTFR